MDSEAFRHFLRRGGRSHNAANRIIRYVREFADYLRAGAGLELDEATDRELVAFVDQVEKLTGKSAKGHLWGIIYYYQFVENEALRQLAALMRAERIQRRPLALKEFRGVDSAWVKKLAAHGISHVRQMLTAGRTPAQRIALATALDVPARAILELVRLADLARIPGIKGIRARLYHDAGVISVEELAARDPEALHGELAEFVTSSGFDGIAPLPAEVRYSVTQAKRLPSVVVWERNRT